MATKKLKYLFEAVFLDGSKFKQNPEDTSIKFPPIINEDGTMSGKSSFTDILEDIEKNNIRSFSLVEVGFFPHRYSVDLTDGHFEIDGVRIEVEGTEQLPISNPVFTLIYYRTRKHNIQVEYEKLTGAILKADDLGESPTKYVIGWQTSINGKNFQQKILVE